MIGERESTGIEMKMKMGKNNGREREDGPWEESRNFKLNLPLLRVQVRDFALQ
jgi:hypothetical protein